MFENAVGGDAEGVLDRKELAELIQQGQGETGVAAQFDFYAGEGGFESRHQVHQHGHDAGMTGGISRTQARRQQAAAVALEDEHGVIHMLVVSAVEEAELLLAVGGVVGGIEVEQNLTALAHLVAAETDELLDQSVIEVHQVAGARRVLPATEGGLRAQRVAESLIGDDLQHRIVAQTIGIVSVFVAGHDLVDALSKQFERIVADALVCPRIAEQCSQIAGQMMALVEGAQRQQAGVAGDLPAAKIGANELMTVEGEVQLW